MIDRRKKLGLILRSWDFLSSLFFTLVLATSTICTEFSLLDYGFDTFLENATSMSISLIAVIVTGIAIVVSMTTRDYLLLLKKNGVYDKVLFAFEYTTVLAILTSVVGILLQSVDYDVILPHVFVFLYLYLVFATLNLLRWLMKYGSIRGKYRLVDELGKELEDIEDNSSEVDEEEEHN